MTIQKRLLGPAILLLLAAGLFGVAASQGDKPPVRAPHAVVDQAVIRIGSILEGQDVRQTFRIRNTGNADLRILNVKPG